MNIIKYNTFPYTPSAWYWIVAGEESQVYSSAKPGFVPATDAGYAAWLDDGGMATRIASLDELRDVLLAQAPDGWLLTGNDQIKSQIAQLEDSVTERRIREAVLGTDNGWLKNVDGQIAGLRAKLK